MNSNRSVLNDPEIGQVVDELRNVNSYPWYRRNYTFWIISEGNTYEDLVSDLSESLWNLKAVVASTHHALMCNRHHQTNKKKIFFADNSYAKFELTASEQRILERAQEVLGKRLRRLKDDYRDKKRDKELWENQRRREELDRRLLAEIESENRGKSDKDLFLLWRDIQRKYKGELARWENHQVSLTAQWIERHFKNDMKGAIRRLFPTRREQAPGWMKDLPATEFDEAWEAQEFLEQEGHPPEGYKGDLPDWNNR